MIQRIQTIYLLIAVIMLIIVFFQPLAEFNELAGSKIYLHENAIISAANNQKLLNTTPLMILLIICIGISFITIFLFKNRKLQMRLCVYNIILMIGMFGLIYYFYKVGLNQVIKVHNISIVSQKMLITSLSPIFASFFTYLAFKKILKDEVLIKSIDRIR